MAVIDVSGANVREYHPLGETLLGEGEALWELVRRPIHAAMLPHPGTQQLSRKA